MSELIANELAVTVRARHSIPTIGAYESVLSSYQVGVPSPQRSSFRLRASATRCFVCYVPVRFESPTGSCLARTLSSCRFDQSSVLAMAALPCRIGSSGIHSNGQPIDRRYQSHDQHSFVGCDEPVPDSAAASLTMNCASMFPSFGVKRCRLARALVEGTRTIRTYPASNYLSCSEPLRRSRIDKSSVHEPCRRCESCSRDQRQPVSRSAGQSNLVISASFHLSRSWDHGRGRLRVARPLCFVAQNQVLDA